MFWWEQHFKTESQKAGTIVGKNVSKNSETINNFSVPANSYTEFPDISGVVHYPE